jgi:hypothetical protein
VRFVSLNRRAQIDAESSDQVETVLIKIDHPLLDAPLRLSSDNTERLSEEPLSYGTRSTWLTEDGSPFLFILLGAQIPDEQDDAPAAASLVIANLDSDLAIALTSTTKRASVSIALVYASSPDVVEQEFLDLKLVSAEGDADQVSLSVSREPIISERYPTDRMTKERFPGLYA